MACFWAIIIVSFLAIFSYSLAPDSTKNATNGNLSIQLKPPGFKIKTLYLPIGGYKKSLKDFFFGSEISEQNIPILNYTFKNDSLFYTEYTEQLSLAETKKIPISIFKKTINQIKKENIKSKTYYLGTDTQGRDYLSRLLIGSRISLSIGFVAVFISLITGLFFGCLAGYYGGKIDAFILWFINVVWSIPTLLLVIAITLALGKGFWQVFIAIGLTMWVEVARVIRGQIISIKEQQYIKAAKVLGFSDTRIILKHILPNTLGPIIVISAANFATAILMESGLSFLGLGAQLPVPSWGNMIKEHYHYILMNKLHLALLPAGAMLLLVICFMMIGNALRDAFDVKI